MLMAARPALAVAMNPFLQFNQKVVNTMKASAAEETIFLREATFKNGRPFVLTWRASSLGTTPNVLVGPANTDLLPPAEPAFS